MKNTTTKETVKTIALTALVAGVLSFAAGIHYEQDTQHGVQAQAQALVKTVASVTTPLASPKPQGQ